jgi:hypothetical protein
MVTVQICRLQVLTHDDKKVVSRHDAVQDYSAENIADKIHENFCWS